MTSSEPDTAARPHEPGATDLPPPGTGPAADPDSDALRRLADTVPARLDALQRSFDAKIRYDAAQDALIDRLHRDLQAAREDLHFKLLRPVFMDLIGMHDDLCRLLAQPADEAPDAKFRDSVASFLGSIEDTLARYGVAVFREAGDALAPRRQRVVGTVPTAHPGRDARVAERRRPGFAYEDRILRPELVVTYRYTGAPAAPLPEENS